MNTKKNKLESKSNEIITEIGINREKKLEIARTKINSHFLTNHKTHDEIMADKRTGGAMIGFMKCWEWLRHKPTKFD